MTQKNNAGSAVEGLGFEGCGHTRLKKGWKGVSGLGLERESCQGIQARDVRSGVGQIRQSVGLRTLNACGLMTPRWTTS